MSVGTLIEFYFKLIICITITEEPEKLAHQEYDYSQLLQILKEQGFKNFNETRQIKITLEFIPENSPLEQESESPLESICMLL